MRENVVLEEMRCERCLGLTEAFGTVSIGRTILCWCEECEYLARDEGIPIVLNELPCEVCGVETA